MPNLAIQLLRAFKDRMWVPIELNEEHNDTHIKSLNCVESSSGEKEVNEQEEFKLTAKHALCLITLSSGMIIATLDYSGVGNIMGEISHNLGGTTTQTEWIGNAYSLAACVAQLPISSLSDIFGRRNLYMASLTLVLIGSAVCGTSKNMHALIAGRAIQGTGGSGLLVLPEVILADLIPLRQRTTYYSLLMLVWCISAGIAPVIAGAFAEYATWRWFFYLNLIIGGIGLVGSPIGMRLRSDNHDHWRKKLRTIDFGGAFLIVSSTTSLLYALSSGGSSSEHPWNSGSVLAPLVLGVAGIISTGIYEAVAKPKFPIFNYRVFGNLSAALCYIQNVVQGLIMMGLTYFLPTFFQGAKGYDTLVAGACILPLELVGTPFGMAFGVMIDRFGHYHVVNLFLWALVIIGAALLTLMNEDRGIGGLLALQIPVSIGISCLYATLSTTANATNPPYLWTDSTAMMSFCRSMGDSLGTAVGGAVFASQMSTRLAELASQGIDIPKNINLLSIVPIIKSVRSSEVRDHLIEALTGSMRVLFVVILGFALLGFVTTIFQKEYRLDQEYESKQGIEL